jgi:hypothetical protein
MSKQTKLASKTFRINKRRRVVVQTRMCVFNSDYVTTAGTIVALITDSILRLQELFL